MTLKRRNRQNILLLLLVWLYIVVGLAATCSDTRTNEGGRDIKPKKTCTQNCPREDCLNCD